MLDVALSRRMCCSLACKVKTNPRFPWSSCVSPTKRPGTLRINFLVVAKYPQCGPPNCAGIPNGCVSPTTISAPNEPGGVSKPNANGFA